MNPHQIIGPGSFKADKPKKKNTLKESAESLLQEIDEIKGQKEAVNHPSHYGGDTIYETYKVLEAWGLTQNAYIWNCIKYLSRAGKKDPAKTLEDLKKASWYLTREILTLEKQKI